MRLLEVCNALYQSREISRLTLANYIRAARYFSDWLGRDAETQDLVEIKVNQWLVRELETRSKSYVKNLRRDFLIVWRFAADLELAKQPSSRLVRKPRVEPREVTVWPVSWVPRLLAACQKLDGNLKSLPISRAVYMEAYFRVQIDLLCRPSDVRGLCWPSIRGGSVRFTQGKTFARHAAQLSKETLEAIEQLRGIDQLRVFPLSKSSTEVLIAKVFELAGINKPEKQSLGHVRHTGGTEIARRKGCDAARIALGHAPESKVFERHYLSQEAITPTYYDWWRTDGPHLPVGS
jgi:integrase